MQARARVRNLRADVGESCVATESHITRVMLLCAGTSGRPHGFRTERSTSAITSTFVSRDREVDVELRVAIRDEIARAVASRARDPLRYASAVEHGMLLWSGALEQRYRRKAVAVLEVLRMGFLPTPWRFAFMRETSFMPGNADAVDLRDQVEETLTSVEGALRGMAGPREKKDRCPICESDEIEMPAIQSRSADEGMTYVRRCCSCGHVYR